MNEQSTKPNGSVKMECARSLEACGIVTVSEEAIEQIKIDVVDYIESVNVSMTERFKMFMVADLVAKRCLEIQIVEGAK